MARETRIGIALMVLLVGVFGVVVYKKWNGRQPVASIAAAAEETPAAEPAGDGATVPPENPFGNDAPSVPPETTAQAGDPFATTAGGAVPVNSMPAATDSWQLADAPPQTEPAFATEPFVENGPSPMNDAATTAPAQVMPVAQSDPAGEPANATSKPNAESAAAAMPAESAVPGPFTEPAELPASLPVAASNPAKTASDDPFADAVIETVPAAADVESAAASPAAEPAPLVETVTSSDDPFADAGKETAAAAAAPAMDAAAPPRPEADPFADDSVASTTTDVETAPVEPMATTSLTDDPFNTAEVGTGDSSEKLTPSPEPLVPEVSAVPAASASENAAKAPRELAKGAIEPPKTFESTQQPAARPDYCVVTENDSYWAISKRAYGTPAYFHALAKYNATRTPDPNRLKPGMKVLTPAAEELAARFPGLVAQTAATGNQQGQSTVGLVFDAQGRPAYRVGASDTLSGIAQSHLGRASRWVQIYEMNRDVVADAKNLKPGTVLRLPGDASRVRLIPEG